MLSVFLDVWYFRFGAYVFFSLGVRSVLFIDLVVSGTSRAQLALVGECVL